MALLNYYIYTQSDNRNKQDMLYHTVRDTMNPADDARIERIWQLLRVKITMPFAVWCSGSATAKPAQPYSDERWAKLRATLDRKKEEKRQEKLHQAYPLLADAIIEQEKAAPYQGKKDRRMRWHKMREKYEQAMSSNPETTTPQP